MKQIILIFLALVLAANLLHMTLFAQLPAERKLIGYWKGDIAIMGTNLGIMVEVTPEGDSLKATIDIPQQSAAGLALKNIRYTHSTVHFELPAGPGIAIFDGVLNGDSITGAFTQSSFKGTFALARSDKPVSEQEAEGQPPYKQEEVTFQNGDVTLAGTLTLPEKEGACPAVILITGSGPQNRDEEIFGFKPFRLIADHLTRNGIAVLRCDDRGIGGSTGDIATSTTADFATDVETAVTFLRARKDIDTTHIGLIGHSEGGLVAPIVAAKDPQIAFIVLLAGPAYRGDTIILAQLARIMKAGGADEGTIQSQLTMQRKVFATLQSDQGWDELRAEMEAQFKEQIGVLPEEQRKSISNVDELMKTRVDASLAGVKTPWFRYFATYDPAPALSKLTTPVLALFGELDTQVPADMNKQGMKDAFKKGGVRDFTIKVMTKANHLFQSATTGAPDEYPKLEKKFVPGFLELITSWIVAKTGVKNHD